MRMINEQSKRAMRSSSLPILSPEYSSQRPINSQSNKKNDNFKKYKFISKKKLT